MEVRTECPHCGTQYLEPVSECDWCPGVLPLPAPKINGEHKDLREAA